MNLITRRPPEDSLGDAGALAPLSAPVALAIFVFRAACRLRSTRPFPSSESCHLSRVSETSLLPLGKNTFRQRSNTQKAATSHKYHRRGKSARRRRGKEKERERDVGVEGVAPRRCDNCRSNQRAFRQSQQKSPGGGEGQQ